MTPRRKSYPTTRVINNAFIDLPTPTNISSWWNFGSLLGLCLLTQITTGIFLAMHYTPDISNAFSSIIHITQDVHYGWLIRNLHANGASMFFICLYFHIGRGLYYSSYFYKTTWTIGILLLLTIMATAFLGYVLPWGQMSFWGATVITNLLSAIPYIGPNLVQWIWGGFAVDNATLTRFFTMHFLLPFFATALTLLHLLFLHETGSSNPTGLPSNLDKIPFHPYFSKKDLVGMAIMYLILLSLTLFSPYLLGDPDNFIPANPLTTPPHIKPEWYFLFAYAILRSIPNKLGGVMALLLSIGILLLAPMLHNSHRRGMAHRPFAKITFWAFITNIFVLTWLGAQPVEEPYILCGQVASILHFSLFLIFMPLANAADNKLMK